MVDFDFGIEQPTPWQWVDEIPGWMRLSFHDHPPLVFWLEHLSIKFFGENPVAVRIPSALAGIASVIFLYFIGRRLYSPPVGAISALLFAVTTNHVWISRIGLQESVLIAFILASFAAFLKGLERPASPAGGPRWLVAAGALLGFAFLAKYNALILAPIFLTILVVRRRDLFRSKWLLLALFCFLLTISPVVIYNVGLYRAFGHFDFQFSLLFGQDVAAWQSRPGQEVLGSYADRIRDFFPRLIEANSPYFLILSVAGLIAIFWELIRRRTLVMSHSSLVIILFWLLPFLVFVGPARRFLTLLTPWLALAAGYAIALIRPATASTVTPYSNVLKNIRIRNVGFAAALALVVAGEALYASNSVVALAPAGAAPWAHSRLRREAHAWGFNELEAYLASTLKGKMPAVGITFEFPFSRKLLNEAAAQGRREGREAVPWGIVYNDNISVSAQLWVFLRRITYEGWPVASAENFRRGGGEQFFRDAGIQRIIFVNATDAALQDRPREPSPDGDLMEAELRARGLTPREIKNARGEIAFRVYEFALAGSADQ